jgi:hypothetical protein
MSPDTITGITAAAEFAGYGIGQIVGHYGARHVATSEGAVIKNWGKTTESSDSGNEDSGAQERSSSVRLLKFIAPLALVGAVIGGVSATTLLHERTHQRTVKPAVELVVDNDYDSGIDHDFSAIDNLAQNIFSNNPKDNVELLLAHNGDVEPTTLDKLFADTPFGPASVDRGLSDAIANVQLAAVDVQSTALGEVQGKSAAVIVETDGNSVGTESTLIASAKAAGNVPILIVNFNANNATNLEEIATGSGGKYWQLTAKNASKVESELDAAITPSLVPEAAPKQKNDTRLDVIDALAILAFAGGTGQAYGLKWGRKSKIVKEKKS